MRARAVVNTAGPWVDDVLRGVIGRNAVRNVRLVKGSHIVVPRIWPGEEAFILQNDDKRIVFIIPYEGRFSLIGTTDLPYDGDPGAVAIDEGEVDYLLRAVNRYLKRPLAREAIVWTYSGVRPLYDDAAANPSAVTRDYVFDLDASDGQPPLLSVFGGKLTTYRRLAEHALERLVPLLKASDKPWTGNAPLPGGDIEGADFDAFLADLRRARPWLGDDLALRLARAYGTRVERVLNGAQSRAALGEEVAPGLFAAELDYLMHEEWARAADDVLWRRSKLGLHLKNGAGAAVAGWLARARADAVAAK